MPAANKPIAVVAGDQSTERRRLTRDQRREQLLHRAATIFSEVGYHNVSMDDVAQRAGISKALLYQHFASKDDLYLAVLRLHQLRLREIVSGEPVTAQEAPAERLWHALVAFFEFVERNPAAWGVFYRDAVAIEGKVTRGVHSMRVEIAERVAFLLEQAINDQGVGDEASRKSALRRVSPLAHALVGTAEALADYWAEHPEETTTSLAQTVMNLVWVGFDGLLEGQSWRPPREELVDD